MAATMNHNASMLSPRLKAIAARAKVPSRMATIHPMKEIGLGKRCVIVVAIATKLPRAALQCGVSYRRKGRVVYSVGVSGRRRMRAAPGAKGECNERATSRCESRCHGDRVAAGAGESTWPH